MDRPYESCEEFYARQEQIARWREELDTPAEDDEGGDAYDPDRGGGFI